MDNQSRILENDTGAHKSDVIGQDPKYPVETGAANLTPESGDFVGNKLNDRSLVDKVVTPPGDSSAWTDETG